MDFQLSTYDVFVEVDLSALKHNLRQVRGALASDVKLMAVVKANGFGHGYVEPSRAFLEAGADALAVTRIEEALTIRAAGISAPILLFAPIQPENAEIAVREELEMTVTGAPLAHAISAAAEKLGKTASVHVKFDTGMSRLGLPPDDGAELIALLKGFSNIRLAGVYTHFATAAERDVEPARRRLARFQTLLRDLKESGIDYGLAHAANSAAIVRLPESHLDMVRPGTLLYGQYPSPFVPQRLDLKPTWKLKARICEIKKLPAGAVVGYGAEHSVRRKTIAAVIPVGYADGFTLVPAGPVYRQSVLKFMAKRMRRDLCMEVRGHYAPVIGRVAMQMSIVDVTDIPDVAVGDEVTIPAMRIPTSALIPRVYVP